MQESLLSQGLDLMVFGMGAVVVFLAILVVVTTVMSKIVVNYFPEPIEDASFKQSSRSTKSQGSSVDKNTLAAIKAAIEQHRNRH